MDKFDVPKNLNRHVLKAIYFINGRGNKNPKRSDIMRVLRATLKDSASDDLSTVVLKSLKNLTKLGVLRKCGTSFSMDYKNKSKEDRKSKLNPNLKKRRISESSSEGGIEKSRKRFSVNRPFVRKGQEVELPKVRTHQINDNFVGNNFKEVPSETIKTGLNARRKRNLDTPTSDCALKKKRFRSSRPEVRKRLRSVPRSRKHNTFDLCIQNASVRLEIEKSDSVHMIYESNHFSKDSSTKIDTHQVKNQSINSPSVSHVTKPDTKQVVNTARKTDE